MLLKEAILHFGFIGETKQGEYLSLQSKIIVRIETFA